MAEQTVTLTLDASQYYRELARIESANKGIGRSGEAIGDGFLRSDRIVGRAAADMTSSLFGIRDAADAISTSGQLASNALLGFERIGKVGIAAAVGLAVAGATIAKIASQSAEAKKAAEDLTTVLNR